MSSSRTKNFTEREKSILCEIIKKYKGILVNKKTNNASMKQKYRTWCTIMAEFNATAEHPRSAKQLQNLYMNLKRQTRKDSHKDSNKVDNENVTSYRHELEAQRTRDGKEMNKPGGASFRPALTEVGAQVLAGIEDQVQPLRNPFDSAAEYLGHNIKKYQEEVVKPEQDISEEPAYEVYMEETPEDCEEQAHEHSVEPAQEVNLAKSTILPRFSGQKSIEDLKKQLYQRKIEKVLIQKRVLLLQEEKEMLEVEIRKRELCKLELEMN